MKLHIKTGLRRAFAIALVMGSLLGTAHADTAAPNWKVGELDGVNWLDCAKACQNYTGEGSNVVSFRCDNRTGEISVQLQIFNLSGSLDFIRSPKLILEVDAESFELPLHSILNKGVLGWVPVYQSQNDSDFLAAMNRGKNLSIFLEASRPSRDDFQTRILKLKLDGFAGLATKQLSQCL